MYASIKLHRRLGYSNIERKRKRIDYMNILVRESDVFCLNELRMDRRAFGALCEMVTQIGGLQGTRNTCVEEIVSRFLYVLSHYHKNRTLAMTYYRSGETISRHFNQCLVAILKLHTLLFKSPDPVTDACTDDRWKYFKVTIIYRNYEF
jgi:hypothetical protein